jgi:uncharacterized protein (DUF1015 family)
VASRPYDVLSSEEARTEAAGNDLSFLRVTKPEIDFPPGTDPYDERVYRRGKENFQRLIADGVVVQDRQPRFYLYALTAGSHSQFGFVGCVAVREYENGTIRRHELTRPDKENDRTKHIEFTNAQTGPVFLAYRARPELNDIAGYLCLKPPECAFVPDDGVQHRLWVIDDESIIGQVAEAFRRVNTLYIADGHHRAAAAARVARQRASANPQHTGNERYNFFLAAIFPHDQLQILEYNRLVKDLNSQSCDAFLENLRTAFDIEESPTAVRPDRKGTFGMYLDGTWYSMVARPQMHTRPEPTATLDMSILQDTVLAPLLGINDPRTDKRIDFVGGIRGVEELKRRVDSGETAVAFTLHPVSAEELFAIADRGHIMPPKSTWFEPKLRDGIVVHLLG